MIEEGELSYGRHETSMVGQRFQNWPGELIEWRFNRAWLVYGNDDVKSPRVRRFRTDVALAIYLYGSLSVPDRPLNYFQ